MSGVKRTLYVICSSKETQRDLQARQALYPELKIQAIFPVRSAVQLLREIAARPGSPPFLICRENIWFGVGISSQVDILIGELETRYPNWALCGNRGMRWDGKHVYDYTADIIVPGLQTAVCPHSVISIDDNILLINPAVLRKHTRLCPAIDSLRCGALLSLECLQNGSLLAVSPRLMSVRIAPDNAERESLNRPEFRAYYRSAFVNEWLYTVDGPLNLSETVDYSYVSAPGSAVSQQDVLNLYDRGLARARSQRRPSLTIACRTQFRRLELLERACLSFSACQHYGADLADLRVQLITDQAPECAEPILARLRAAYPLAAFECLYHEIRPNRHSRTDLLLAAIEQAQTDYIWFIDDDDYVIPPAIPALARCLVPDAPVIVISSSLVMDEKWSKRSFPQEDPSGGLELIDSSKSLRYPAAALFQILKGRNFIPNCSMILPVALMRERLKDKLALGDFNEDYYLLLLALTASRAEVCVLDTELAVISIRGRENTVAQSDRSGWHLAYATFMLEILNNQDANSPFLWQQANAAPWVRQ
jgi:glycosyltransferase involved in cell wall biosynthesis